MAAPDLHPRRIVHVTEAPLGGVVTYLDELLSLQIKMMPDTAIDLITPSVNRPALEHLWAPNFTIIDYPMRRGSKKDLAALGLRIIGHLRRTRPEILHIHSTFAGAAVRGLDTLIPRGCHTIYCPHGWAFSREGSGRGQKVVAQVERLLSRVTDRIVCISEYECRAALEIGIAPEKLVVIDNGISPRPEAVARSPRADGKLLIAFAGRFDRQKGYDTFIEVMRRLGDKAHAQAIGSAIVSSDALPDTPPNVELLGWQPREKVFDLFARADLLLVPSRWEGFGLVAGDGFAVTQGGGVAEDGGTTLARQRSQLVGVCDLRCLGDHLRELFDTNPGESCVSGPNSLLSRVAIASRQARTAFYDVPGLSILHGEKFMIQSIER